MRSRLTDTGLDPDGSALCGWKRVSRSVNYESVDFLSKIHNGHYEEISIHIFPRGRIGRKQESYSAASSN